MKTTTKTFQALIRDFFEEYLAVERNVSRNTILAYRDALKLFLKYVTHTQNCASEQLEHTVLSAENVRAFLRWLESERANKARTRNHRLAALKALARYCGSVEPQHLESSRAIREIQSARIAHPEPGYLDEDEIAALIKGASNSGQTLVRQSHARRDHALLTFLYNTGARVQELVDLNIVDFHAGATPFVRLTGKGNKQRTCPLWARTVESITRWLALRGKPPENAPLFINARGERLTRSGVAYILRRAAKRAGLVPQHAPHLTPHIIRHSTAMALVAANVDITSIAAWLGHSGADAGGNLVAHT